MDRGDYSRLGDAELLRIARKDTAAYREFYGRHAQKLDGWVRKCVGNPDIAKELTAETFAEAYVGLKRFKPDADGDGAGWLYGIARNLVRQYFRKERVERSARKRLGVLEETTVSDASERVELATGDPALQAAVDRLPEHERAAVRLRVVSEMSYREVSEVLGCTETAARIRVSRALQRLRDELESCTEVDEIDTLGLVGGNAGERAATR